MARVSTVQGLRKLDPELFELNVVDLEVIKVDSSCRTKLACALALAYQCGLKLWYSEALHQVFVSKGESVSKGIFVESNTLTGIIAMLEFMQSVEGILESRLDCLEARVRVLEKTRGDTCSSPSVAKPTPGSQALVTRVSRATEISEEDRLHYLILFRRRQAEFKEAGIELEFDLENQQVSYSSPNRSTPQTYDISRTGYKNAIAALRSRKRRQAEGAKAPN